MTSICGSFTIFLHYVTFSLLDIGLARDELCSSTLCPREYQIDGCLTNLLPCSNHDICYPLFVFFWVSCLSFGLAGHIFRVMVCELYLLLLPPYLNSIYPLSSCTFPSTLYHLVHFGVMPYKNCLILASLKILYYFCLLKIAHLGDIFVLLV